MDEIGREVRRLREQKGWSQAELAVYSRSSQPTVNQVESGKRNPSTRTLQKLARALGVEVADLFPKAATPLPFEEFEEETSAERRLLNRARLLVRAMDKLAAYWEHVARSGRVSGDVHDVVARHRRVFEETLGDELESMAEEGLDWDNHMHAPSRHVQRELQRAFNRWDDAWHTLEDAFEKGLTGGALEERRAKQEEEEERFEGVSEKLRARGAS